MAVMCRRFAYSVVIVTLLFFTSCNSDQAPNYSFLKESITAPETSYYDYIVVGGGTAGCALGATLSSGARVLILERGGSPYGNRRVQNVESFGADLANVSPTSPSQLFISEDGVYNHRPRVLGGGSAINAGFYTRASVVHMAEAGWEADEAERAYEWVEKKVAFEPEMKQWQSMVKEGLLEVGVSPDNGFTYKHLPGTKVGGSIFDLSGHRHTAADLLEYADPGKITVYLHAVVHKILFFNSVPGSGSRPKASGVAFKDAAGILHTAFLNPGPSNEVILSAGAIGSPQLLMLSGIGPEEHLRFHGIPVLLNQPMVGQGMSDNPMNAIMMATRKPVEVSLIQTVGIADTDRFYVEAASGIAFGRIDPQNLHIPKPLINAGTILEKISGPRSSGDLKLRNLDPNDTPKVRFNYFQDPDDLKSCVEGMSAVVNLYNSKAFSEFRFPGVTAEAVLAGMLTMPLNLRPRHLKSVVSLDQFCRDTVMTIWHYHGGCRAGKVVDENYRVMGVDNLRVVDGSTFNKSPGTNPQATVMMLGRYVGEKMLNERGSNGKL